MAVCFKPSELISLGKELRKELTSSTEKATVKKISERLAQLNPDWNQFYHAFSSKDIEEASVSKIERVARQLLK